MAQFAAKSSLAFARVTGAARAVCAAGRSGQHSVLRRQALAANRARVPGALAGTAAVGSGVDAGLVQAGGFMW